MQIYILSIGGTDASQLADDGMASHGEPPSNTVAAWMHTCASTQNVHAQRYKYRSGGYILAHTTMVAGMEPPSPAEDSFEEHAARRRLSPARA